MTTIYLIRHGEAEGNLYRRCQGHYNSLITDNGYRQIEALADRFKDIPVDAVYSSDLTRAMTTASAIFKPKGLTLNVEPMLREIGVGIWEDKTWGELERDFKTSLASFSACDEDWSIQGGETYPQVRCRVYQVLQNIVQRHPDQVVAAVSHGTAIRAVVSAILQVPMYEIPHCDNTAVACIQRDEAGLRVIYHNDNSHLSADISTFARQTWWRENSSGDNQMWFRPWDPETESELYLSWRRDAWITIHKTMEHYDGQRFLQDALSHSAYDRSAVMVGMLGDRIAGLIQMDFARDADKGIGGIPFCYMTEEFRCKKLGVQLLGQAVSAYRRLGRDTLRLRCAPDNAAAQYFYRKYGFVKSGMATDSVVPLELLDKYIGFDTSRIAANLHF